MPTSTTPVSWTGVTIPGQPLLAACRTGDGPDPVVALHGITAQHRAFNAVARQLRRPDGLLGLDLRGRGNSGKPALGYGLRTHAGDVVRVLDLLGLKRAVLVGHSMGAFVAVQTAISHPARVRALVLLDGGWPRPALRDRGGGPDRGLLRAGLARAYSRLEMTFPDQDAYVRWWFPDSGLTMATLQADLADYLSYDLEATAGGWTPKASLTAARQDALWNRLRSPTAGAMRRVRVPVALVRATEGFTPGTPPLLGPELRDRLAGALPLRTEVLLDGATHYSMLLAAGHAARVAEVIDHLAGAGAG
jgi:pimeloyl-ACP methyl ester carboxylesterase